MTSKRSSFPCPAIRTGGMKQFKSMADGRMYDDRNDYDRHLKDQGLRIFERGEENVRPPEPQKSGVREILEREIVKHV